jgi:hypothetical protein
MFQAMSEGIKEETVGPPTREAMRSVTERVVLIWSDRAAELTPRRTGRTALKWTVTEVVRTPVGYSANVENPSFKARLLEFGIAPHRLKGKRKDALSTPEGPRANADHPGVRPYAMLSVSAAEVEGALEEIAQPIMTAWIEQIEQRAKRHRGIT